MSEKQLDGNANLLVFAKVNASTFPVFDPATPKVSTLSIGMGVLESAIELVNEAEQQTAKFQPKASDKAGFMLTNYELPNPNPGMVSSPYPSLTQRALNVASYAIRAIPCRLPSAPSRTPRASVSSLQRTARQVSCRSTSRP